MYIHKPMPRSLGSPPSRLGLHVWAQAGRIQAPTSLGHLPAAHPGSSWEGPRLPPQHTRTHVQQGTHMLTSGSPRYNRLGVGALSTQSPGCCQNPSESCPPQAPISGCGGHNSRCGYPPPQLARIEPPPFPQSQPTAGAGDRSPCLPPAPPTGPQLLLPPSIGVGGGGLCLGGGPFP